MVWIIVMLMCCLPTVESEECKETEIIVGRLGKKLEFNFTLSDLRDEYNRNITGRNGKKIVLNEFQVQDLRMKYKLNSTIIIYTNGNPTGLVSNLTEIFMTNDTFVVKKTKLQKEDAGIYYIDLNSQVLGKKVLVIAGKPKIEGQSPSNPVLKPEDNYISTIQLECPSVSTSIGECPLSMYTVWYKNGMRMTDVDPISSQINVTIDYNGGNFTCLATDYLPCYQQLQTTKHYDVLNIEECNNVSESETFIVQPEYSPIEVLLEPDQREIIINENEDLKVNCSAKCHPICEIIWKKDFGSSNLVNKTNNMSENNLLIENVNSSHEGYYGCLVNNIHGEVKKGFTLSVIAKPITVKPITVKPITVKPIAVNVTVKADTTNRELVERNNVIVAVTVVIVIVVAVIVIVILVIMYKRYQKQKNNYHKQALVQVPSTEDEVIFEMIDICGGAPLARTYSHNNSRIGVQNKLQESDDIHYAELQFSNGNGSKIRARKADTVVYTTIDFAKKAPPMPKTIQLDSDDED